MSFRSLDLGADVDEWVISAISSGVSAGFNSSAALDSTGQENSS